MSKRIYLKQLILKNFKGIKYLTIDFSRVTNILGDNATGKTTVNDSFTWLLFDKDSHDVSKFDIQPLDSTGNVIDNLETEVTGILEIDGVETTLRKVYKQKWVRKKGSQKPDNIGNTTDYYINEVPQKQGEYKSKINDIIPENVFKLLTSPLYFGLILTWKDRRKIVFDINGDVSQINVFNYNSKLKGLEKMLNPNESMEDFTKRIKAQKAKLKKDQESIPARVDELNRSIKELDFESLEIRKREIQSDINSIEEKILDSSKVNEGLLAEKNKLYDLKSQLKDMEYELKGKAQEPLKIMNEQLRNVESEIYANQSQADRLSNQIIYKENEVSKLEEEIADLRVKWNMKNQETLTFNENEFVCPTCHRPLDDIENKKQEMIENFNQSKAYKLSEINAEGKDKNKKVNALKEEIGELRESFKAFDDKLTELTAQKKEFKQAITEFTPSIDFTSNTEYAALKNQISELETKLQQPADTGLTDLRIEKRELQSELEDVNRQLNAKKQNDEIQQRIIELQAKEKEIAQLIADIENAEYLSDEFIKTKVELLENSINSNFKFAKIKLFNNLVNGGIEECCEVLVNGVPFSTSLNSGARINAGLDVINTLSEFYGVNAPIFIDNKESVTKLIDTDSQMVNLIVSEPNKILKLESEVA